MDDAGLDLLLVSPSLAWHIDQEKKLAIRLEKDIPNQETPHIGVAYMLAVAAKAGIRARYLDMVADRVTPEELAAFARAQKPRVVGFSAFTIQIKAAAQLAGLIKQASPGSLTCAGGPHVSALPQESLTEFPEFDFVVCGESERVIVNLFKQLDAGAPLGEVKGLVVPGKLDCGWDPITEIDSLPFPAWEAFNLDNYPGTFPHRTRQELPMVTGRGCPFKCVFCCRALGNKVRRRSVESVIAEIEHNIERFGCESIGFLDETFVLQKKWSDDFFSTMVRKGLNKKIKWGCCARVSDTSPELFAQMREAGCYNIFFGMESADDATLKQIKKGITVAEIRQAVRWCKEAGIVPVGAFIIGLPGDTEEQTRKAIDLGRELDLYSITFPIAVPFPGTELRELALRGEYGMRIMSGDWDYYGKQDPGVMDSQELSWAKRKELQQYAYSHFPKQKMDDYLERQRGLGYPF